MLRVFTSIIRNAPGPFKGARSLTADFIEGLADVVSPQAAMEQTPPEPIEPRPVRVESPVLKKTNGGKPQKSMTTGTKPAGDLAGAFKTAISRPNWVRRQDFKVLAIFWESRQRGNGPITAKQASTIGDELGLTIRHENIRKVVRTRLTEKIATTTVPDSQPPTFQYEITTTGAEDFERSYLRNAD